jgi:hypothetical protein
MGATFFHAGHQIVIQEIAIQEVRGMRIFLVAMSSFILALLAGLTFVAQAGGQASAADPSRKAVVVELFTSEGCSSCPPADIILQKLEEQQPVYGAEIIPLEEHVDYWNHDGWVDPYSSPEWTERQQNYAALAKEDPYTPELVVDGQTEFVGNNPKETILAIEDARQNPKTDIEIEQISREAKGARFNVSVGKLSRDIHGDVAEVWLAVTEDGLHSSVSRGENAGHELKHLATLRYLRKIGVAEAGGGDSFGRMEFLKFNSRWNADNLNAIVFVQQKKSRQIIGAASIKIKG